MIDTTIPFRKFVAQAHRLKDVVKEDSTQKKTALTMKPLQ